MKITAKISAIIFTLFLIAACGSAGTSNTVDLTKGIGSGGGDVSKTTLIADKTAIPFHRQTFEYDWTIEKTVDLPMVNGVPSITLAAGEFADVAYKVYATRDGPFFVEGSDVYGVNGAICVTNGGDWPTENLNIVDEVQYKTGSGQFQTLSVNEVDISAKPILEPRESYCYAYEVVFTPIEGAVYRNVAHVTITNHAGWIPGDRNCEGPDLCPFGPDPKTDFGDPLTVEPTITYLDEEADIIDHIDLCPNGFFCTPIDAGPVHVTADSVVDFIVTITNSSADCDVYYDLINSATITESGPKEPKDQSSDALTVSVYTGECSEGCTVTIGYWKTHAGFGPQADDVSARLPIWLGTANGVKSVQVTTAAGAVKILEFYGTGAVKDASNGINKLYAQLLGAKLNLSAGAGDDDIASVISAADAFLAGNNTASWAGLSKTQKNLVLSWMTALDDYNNGLTGPGHCE